MAEEADLSPRESEVLDLLRLGLTNGEIAGRLGITLDGAKYHVSQIIGKLGVRDRYEAASWAERRPGSTGVLALVGVVWNRAGGILPVKLSGVAAIASAAGVLVIAVVAVAVLAWQATTGQMEPQTVDFEAPQVVPDPVALVNGDPISGRLVDIAVNQGSSVEYALDYGIDQVLLLQAGERWGLTGTTEEAIEWLRTVEGSWEGISPETRAEFEAIMIAQGLPVSNLSGDSYLIEELGVPTVTVLNARRYIAEEANADPRDLIASQAAVAAFLEKERSSATIVDCRTQSCSTD